MVGIGGIGMSALAQLFAGQGAVVLGSDRSEQPTTKLLREKGVDVLIGHSASHVPEDTDVLVYSDAVVEGSDGYAERVRGRELGVPEMNYFEALGRAAEGKRVVSVSGTNGKTTTTAMIAKILIDAGCDPTVVVGSIVSEWGSNFRPSTHSGKSHSKTDSESSQDIFVVEACEYRAHFLNFHPEVFVITNIELEHTDYYTSLSHIEQTFGEAIANMVPQGTLVANTQDISVKRAIASCPEELEGGADTGRSVVDYTKEQVPELLLPGEFNRDNARAAKAAAQTIAPHIAEGRIDASLATFRGTWRRFEYKGVTRGGATLYDDYAHHPTAVAKTIAAAREKFPNKKIAVIFHPHLYSRTRDLWAGFVDALASADEVYILPVFAAREQHDPSVSAEALAQAISNQGTPARSLSGLDGAANVLASLSSDTVAFTMGAGDVYRASEQALREK